MKNTRKTSLKLLKYLKNKIDALSEMSRFWNKKIELAEQKIVLVNYEILLERGYNFNEVVKLVSYKLNIKEHWEALEQGETFTSGLRKTNFDDDILLIIELGERTGQLKEAIKKANIILNNKIESKSILWQQIKYPLMLFFIMLGGILFVGNFVLPTFASVYESFGMEMNFFMKGIFVFIKFIPGILIIITIACVIGVVYFKNKTIQEQVRLLTKNKTIGKEYYKLYNQVFSTNLTMLLELGMKIDEILSLFSQQKYNYLLNKQGMKLSKLLNEGESLSESLRRQKIYDKTLIQVVEEGMEDGTLVVGLKNYLLVNEFARKKKSERILFLLQPLLYGVFGGLIVLLYASIFFPLFKIMDNI